MYLPPSHVLYMHFSLIFLFRCGDNGPFPAPKSISSYAFAFVYFPFSVGNCWWGLDYGVNEDNPERQVYSIIGLVKVCMIADF